MYCSKCVMDSMLLCFVFLFIYLFPFVVCCCFQILFSTLEAQNTMWMRVMALWKCRCGGQGLIFPKEELSQHAPKRQILSLLRVYVSDKHPSLTASASSCLNNCKLNKTIDLSHQPVKLCFFLSSPVQEDFHFGSVVWMAWGM